MQEIQARQSLCTGKLVKAHNGIVIIMPWYNYDIIQVNVV